jgi:hypothetical protein
MSALTCVDYNGCLFIIILPGNKHYYSSSLPTECKMNNNNNNNNNKYIS